MRTSNDDDIEQQARPIATAGWANRARKREGGVDARDEAVEAAPKGAASPSKAKGHSRTPAPDAEATAATVLYDRSQGRQAEMLKQHSPQREESLQHTFQ